MTMVRAQSSRDRRLNDYLVRPSVVFLEAGEDFRFINTTNRAFTLGRTTRRQQWTLLRP